MNKKLLLLLLPMIVSAANAQVNQKSLNDFLDDSLVKTGFAGIAVYDPSAKKYLLEYNAEKNFMPGSNVKLFTLYAAMKYLGDSIPAAKILKKNDTLFFQPSGDPGFLHPDFPSQPLAALISASKKSIWVTRDDTFNKYGSGWMWDDYEEDFMPERSPFPIYGNLFTILQNEGKFDFIPRWFASMNTVHWSIHDKNINQGYFILKRVPGENIFSIKNASVKSAKQQVPFIFSYDAVQQMLADTLKTRSIDRINMLYEPASKWKKLYARPADSLFRPMMHKSDNFFAEQTLLMVSNEQLGYMNDTEIIDSIVQNDLKDIPTKPRWADGSGLSRYNLFSPKDFIYILDKTEKEFGWERLKNILPTGGEGTLKNYYENIAGLIYAKTGSMSNNVSLSGFIFTQSRKKLIFSVIINNFSGSGRSARKAVEKFILSLRELN